MCRLVGEVADGLLVHPYHSRRYLEEVVRPAAAAGAARAGRDPADVRFFVTAFAVPESRMEPEVRSQIAFYASTPIPSGHGPAWLGRYGRGAESDHAQRGRGRTWIPGVERYMLEAFAVVAAWDDLAGALHRRPRPRRPPDAVPALRLATLTRAGNDW
jgi:alkanesulfonate monooxygenase SsuD/methylene tetrahydromethanopterin reductase-like flavin-dependent oxidoreductase (luciferase family)